VTCRCISEDLNDSPDCSLAELAGRHAVVDKFRSMRSQSPVGAERIVALTGIEAFSLHTSRYRAATWHDRQFAAVWLLAHRIHREGHASDAYPYFVSLHANDRLLPLGHDYDRLYEARARRLLPDAIYQIRSAVEGARAEPNREISVMLNDGTQVIALVEADPPLPEGQEWYKAAIIYISFSPAKEMQPGWLPSLVGGALPDVSWDEWELAHAFPHRPLRGDEVAFSCG